MNQKGFSLIEIMIVMAILAAVIGIGATVVLPGNEAKLREQSVKLAGTIKFLHDASVMKNRYYRIVFNLDNKSYSVESSSEPVLVALEAEGKSKTEKPIEPAEDETPPEASPEKGFSPDADSARPVRLPEGIKIKDILVMHEAGPRQDGIVHLYFFPNGWVEPAIVNFSDDQEESFMSMEINPLTGRAKMRNEYFESKEGTLRSEGEK